MRSTRDRIASIVVDLGYGDSGKGGVTDYLCGVGEDSLVIRFNGGSQAAHGVTEPGGRRHVFAQFGSGMLRPGVRTLLSKHMLVSPLAMLSEERCLRENGVKDAFHRTDISEDALIISPFQRAANRLREIARGGSRHGSCGHGVGETASDALRHPDEALRAAHLSASDLPRRLRRIQERKRAEAADAIAACRNLKRSHAEIACLEDASVPERWVERLGAFLADARIRSEDDVHALVRAHGHLVFEGAQGVLLDEWRGFHPYTTWSTCTFDNALSLLDGYGWDGDIIKIGVIRGYATRHGAGPFPTGNAMMTRLLPDADNVMNDWQKGFRVGWLDLVAIRYAIAACGGIDALAVTCLDRLKPIRTWDVCDAYETPTGTIRDLSLGPRQDLAHQESLTSLLASAKPKYRMTTDREDFDHKAIEHALAVNSLLGEPAEGLLISTGPTRADKTVIF
ncbi:MAG: adenylosuccinate synthetase [Patescibacteria group bacterium]